MFHFPELSDPYAKADHHTIDCNGHCFHNWAHFRFGYLRSHGREFRSGKWWSPPPPNSEVTVNSANSTQVRKTKLPLTIGVTFSIFSASIALFNLLIAWFVAPLVLEPGWWDSGETPEELKILFNGFILVVTILGVIGIVAGFLIAKRRRIGVYIAWGLCVVSLLPSLIVAIAFEVPPDPVSLVISLSCAVWVGIPMLVTSSRIHMR